MTSKLIRKTLCSALLLASAGAVFADPAPAVACSSYNSSWSGCSGMGSANHSLTGANAAFDGDSTYGFEYLDGDADAGSDNTLFDLIANGSSFTLSFLQDLGDGSGAAVVGLKVVGQGSQQVGYFRFDNADFDIGDTLSFSWAPVSKGGHIASAAVYSVTPAALAVPEPGSSALMLAGLLAAAVATRRGQRG